MDILRRKKPLPAKRKLCSKDFNKAKIIVDIRDASIPLPVMDHPTSRLLLRPGAIHDLF